jgi:hypothetical protein
VSRKEKLSGGEVLVWTLAGLGTGALAGVLLAGVFGRGGGTRIRRVIQQWRPSPAGVRRVSTVARDTQAALDACDLVHFSLNVLGVSPGVIELHGWVPTRVIRARAARIAAAVPGVERVVNSILVLGEDDKGFKPPRKLADQSA